MNCSQLALVATAFFFFLAIAIGSPADAASGGKLRSSDSAVAPQIVITGETGTATGYVVNVNPSDYHVALFIFITGLGWFSKPTFAQPYVAINADGTWSGDVVTGGVDAEAGILTALVVPASDPISLADGADSIPADDIAVSIASATAQIPNPSLRTIDFAGQKWDVKYISVPVGPGPCNFSNSPNNVWVDSAGLHLKITNDGGVWHTAEVLSEQSFGLGTYTFTLATPVDNLDPNVVLGLYTWSDNAAYTHSEIDTEFSRWSNAQNPQNAQYVRQPPTSGNIMRFVEPAGLQTTTHSFDWGADSIDFASWIGNSATLPTDSSSVIQQWTYTGDIPPPTDEKCHINLWLNGGVPPTDGNDVEVVISNFQFQAQAAAPLAPAANDQTVPVAFNTPAAITLTGSDPNTPAESLTYVAATQPAHGTLTGAAPNLTYTPATGYSGSDSFTFTTINTSNLTSSPATVNLNVAPGVPTATAQTIAVGFNMTTAVSLSGSDPNVPAEALTYTIVMQPEHGTLYGTLPNLTYTPTTGYSGSDIFTFAVKNSSGLTSAQATVTLNVAAGSPLIVTSTGDSSVAGSGSLRAAIAYANGNPGSTISFSPSVFASFQKIVETQGTIDISASVTINGPAGGVAVDGNNANTVFNVSGGTMVNPVTLSKLTIQNGNSSIGAGALYNSAGNVVATNCTFVGNNATSQSVGDGGAIFNFLGTIALTNCSFRNNTVVGVPSVLAGGGGGAIYTSGGTVSMYGCSLIQNTATGPREYGGSIVCDSGNLIMSGCTVSNCSANSGGGGIYTGNLMNQNGSSATISNCTFYGNKVTSNGTGGAIEATGPLSLTNCTVSGNGATAGGGIYISATAGMIDLTSDIFWDDNGGEIDGTGIVTYSDIQGGYSGTGNIDQDPMFAVAGLADNGGPTQTMALQDGSPCLGAGTPNGAPATDQRGIARPNPPSIGAYDVTSRGPSSPIHTFAAGLTMFSVPTTYGSLSLAAVLGYDATLAVWDPSAGQYDVTPSPPANSLVTGPAYWVRFPDTETITSLGATPPTTIPFAISLKSGWNMIGCPQTSPVAINTLNVIDASNLSHSFAGAESGGLVSGTLYTFQPGDTHYEVLPSATGSLRPYYGYWLYASQPCTLSFPAIVPPAPPVPGISFTVPKGATTVSGTVSGVDPRQYGVVVYISVPNQGWWIKPYADSPVSAIGADGSWSCDIVTGGNDNTATEVAAFLIPLTYSPPILEGGSTPNLDTNAVASLFVTRES